MFTPEVYKSLAIDEVKHCNLCGSTKRAWGTKANGDRYGFPAHTYICLECGLTFISPRMSAASYAAFYNDGHYRELTQHSGKLEESQDNYAHMMAKYLQPYLETYAGCSLLDVGGSRGITAQALKKAFDVNPFVLDPNDSELAHARSLGLPTINDSIETWKNTLDLRFDVVTIFQSIDHMLDIRQALNTVRDCLEPGGILVLDIVEVVMLMDRLKHVERTCKIDHPFGLSEATMTCYLGQLGFDIIGSGASPEKSKLIFIARKGVPSPSMRPRPETIIQHLAIMHRVRLEQYYAFIDQVYNRIERSSGIVATEIRSGDDRAGSDLVRNDTGYD